MQKRKKKDHDFSVTAFWVVQEATGQVKGGFDARALGRLRGLKGGKARAEKLSPERWKEIAVQAEIDRQTEGARLEQVRIDKLEANKKHVGAVRKAAKEAIMTMGINEAVAKKIVLAIHAGNIPSVTISYGGWSNEPTNQ